MTDFALATAFSIPRFFRDTMRQYKIPIYTLLKWTILIRFSRCSEFSFSFFFLVEKKLQLEVQLELELELDVQLEVSGFPIKVLKALANC